MCDQRFVSKIPRNYRILKCCAYANGTIESQLPTQHCRCYGHATCASQQKCSAAFATANDHHKTVYHCNLSTNTSEHTMFKFSLGYTTINIIARRQTHDTSVDRFSCTDQHLPFLATLEHRHLLGVVAAARAISYSLI